MSPKNQIHSCFYFTEQEAAKLPGHELRQYGYQTGDYAEYAVFHLRSPKMILNIEGTEIKTPRINASPKSAFTSSEIVIGSETRATVVKAAEEAAKADTAELICNTPFESAFARIAWKEVNTLKQGDGCCLKMHFQREGLLLPLAASLRKG